MSWSHDLARAATAVAAGDAAGRLTAFVELFATWNRRINLSAARTHDELAQHVVDSLAVVPHVRGAATAIDVGSGGGFPALVVAACLPDLALRCVEPIHKKTAFLSAATRELKLPHVEVVARRVDESVDTGFDVAMSRATFAIDEWLGLGVRLVRPGGRVLGMEARAQIDLGPTDERHVYELADRQRAVIVRRVP